MNGNNDDNGDGNSLGGDVVSGLEEGLIVIV